MLTVIRCDISTFASASIEGHNKMHVLMVYEPKTQQRQEAVNSIPNNVHDVIKFK